MTRPTLEQEIEQLTHDGFAGVVRLDVAGRTVLRSGFGMADRARGLPMTPSTRLAMASGSKTLTALAVLSLVDDGVLSLTTTARSLLGDDLPLVADDVTVEHLLSHRSGIGDYLDEESDVDLGDYPMPVSVHRLDRTEAFVPLLDGHPTKFPAGTRFSYCNGGFVILALLAERASGTPYHRLVEERVCQRAGLAATRFLRSDSLPGDAALGYVEVDGEWRTNVFHLPVRGTGDGGAFTTVDDMHDFWPALVGGRIVSGATVQDVLRPRSDPDESGAKYGLGLWLDQSDGSLQLLGEDAGVSFTTVHLPREQVTWTVMANAMGTAWPVHRAVAAHVGTPVVQT
ncbi:MAG TPA: serine hydrolase domain-containing protein [Nocardioides sp.]|nr:serine hydrolase domain-containing protein [Nocardioides sp.]